MSKSFRKDRLDRLDRFNTCANTQFVLVEDIYVCNRTMEKIMRRDRAQVEQLRRNYEEGRHVIRVVLRPRHGGGYNIEDGRHRVIAAKLARVAFIEALIVA